MLAGFFLVAAIQFPVGGEYTFTSLLLHDGTQKKNKQGDMDKERHTAETKQKCAATTSRPTPANRMAK